MRRLQFVALEKKIVFDATAVAAVLTEMVNHNPPPANQSSDSSSQTDSFQTDNHGGDTPPNHGTSQDPTDSPVVSSTTVLVVNKGITDASDLVNAAKDGVKVITYDPNTSLQDLLHQIDVALNGSKITTLAWATSGDHDALNLTLTQSLNSQNIDHNIEAQNFFHELGLRFQDNGRFDLLACHVAQGDALLVSRIDALLDNAQTGHFVSVAASTDVTANAAQGGNWVLEHGNVNVAPLYFNTDHLINYSGQMDVQNAFSTVYSTTTHGDFILKGNTILHTSGTLTSGSNNDSTNMIYTDTDNDSSTFNSSSANLFLPGGTTAVKWAGLYWFGQLTQVAGTTAAQDASSYDQVLLKTPTNGFYQTITADPTHSYTGYTQYQNFADVTSIVQAGGLFTVANIQTITGATATGIQAGWALAVVYELPTAQLNHIVVQDGYASLSSSQGVNVTFSGLGLKPFPTGKIGIVAYEGDQNALDELKINGLQISGGGGGGGYFNSSFSNSGAAPSSVTTDANYVSGYTGINNFLGFDIKTINNVSLQTNTNTLQFSSIGDVYSPAVVAFSSAAAPASFTMATTATDINGGTLDFGDTVRYSVTFNHLDALGNATNAVFTDSIPTYTTYVANSLKLIAPDAVSYTDILDSDAGKVVSGLITLNLGTGATSSLGGTLVEGANYTVQFDVIYNGEQLPDMGMIQNTAKVNFTQAANNYAVTSTHVSSAIDHTPTVSSSIGTVVEGNTGSSTVVVTVTLSHPSTDIETVTYQTTDGTAVAGSDYTATSGTLTFQPGETSKQVTLNVTGDSFIEGAETLNFQTTLVQSGVQTESVITIPNDDAIVTISDTAVVEGNNLVFGVTLSQAASHDINVFYSTVNGTAVAGSDFTGVSGGFITIAAGQTTGQIVIAVTNDLIVEGAESMQVQLDSVSPNDGGSITVSSVAATGTITDNDTATISIGNATIVEGGILDFTVTMSNPASTDVTLNYSLANITTASGDYIDLGNGTITFTAGSTVAHILVQTVDDTVVENNETLSATIAFAAGSPFNPGITLSNTSSTGTITNNDTAIITLSNATVNEGSNAVFNWTSSNQIAADVTVNLTSNGSGSEQAVPQQFSNVQYGEDYRRTNSFTILAGQTSGTVAFTTHNDSIVELTETFSVTMQSISSTITSGITLGGPATGTILDFDTATVNVYGQSQLESDGSPFFGFQLNGFMSLSYGHGITVSYVITGGTATNGMDYTGLSSGTITIPGSLAASANLYYTILNDTLSEPNETITLQITGISSVYGSKVTIGLANGTTTIVDNDPAQISITNETTAEGGALLYRVTLSNAISQNITVNYFTSNGSATAGSDYVAVTGSVTFVAGGSLTQTIAVSTIPDNIVDSGNETVLLNLGTISPNYSGRITVSGVGIGTITDTDAAIISVSKPTVTEGGALDYVFSMTKPAQMDVVINYTLNDVTTSSDDYTGPMSGSVTITAGQTTAHLLVQTLDNTIVENNEVLQAQFELATNYPNITLATLSAAGTIVDNDTITVTIANATITEGGDLDFVITLSNPVQDAIDLDYTLANITTSGADYQGTTGTIHINAGETTAHLIVSTVDDSIVELSETLQVTLVSSHPGVTFDSNTAIGTIQDNDTVNVSIGNASVTDEGETLNFTVTLDHAATEDITLHYTTSNGTALAGADYTGVTNGTIVITAGSTSGVISITTLDDHLIENPQSLSLTLTSATSDHSLPINLPGSPATGTINDTDSGVLTLSNASFVTEGNNLVYNFSITQPFDQDVQIFYTATGGGATNGSVTLAAGQTTGQIIIATLDDSIVELGETVSVSLVGVTPGYEHVTTVTTPATGTILSDDTATVTVSSPSITEGGQLSYVITLSNPVASNVTVTYSLADGTATLGSDYAGLSPGVFGSVLFTPGTLTRTITVDTVNDTLSEGNETVFLHIESVSVAPSESGSLDGLVTIGSPSTGTGTIVDNDGLNISISSPTVTEGGQLDFVVTSNLSTDSDIEISYTIANITTAGSDYSGPLTGTVTILAGQTTGHILVQTSDDALLEHSESLNVTLDSVISNNGIPISLPAAGSGTIIDNDAATVTISDAPTVSEGGHLVFGVTLSHAASEDINVYYSTINGTAVAGSDFTGVSGGFITIAAGQTTGQIVIAVTDDALVEHSESLQVQLNSVSPSYSDAITVSNIAATGTITENDAATVTISDAPTVTEGGHLVFGVTLSHAASEDLNVYYSTVNGTAVAGSDFTGVSGGFITIAAGQTTGQIVIAVADDAVVEHTESLQVKLDSVSPSYSDAITVSTTAASGTITDNDAAIITISDAPTVTEDGNLVFAVTLSHAASEDINVYYSTINGSAVAGSDFTGVSGGFITIAAGQTTGQIVIAVTDDAFVEHTESLQVKLDSVSPSYSDAITVSTTAASGTINDNDTAIVTISNAPTVTEGGNLIFGVTLSHAASEDINVYYSTVNGTAVAGSDFTGVSGGFITIAAGQTTGQIVIAVTDDVLVELSESLRVQLNSVSPSYSDAITVSTTAATGTITDNDAATVTISDAPTVTEGGHLVFDVTLSHAASEDINVYYSTVNGTAVTGNDFTGVNGGFITIAAGQTTGQIVIAVADDTVVEHSESLQVKLDSVSPSYSDAITVSTTAASGTITDNDTAIVTISDAPTVTEGGHLVFGVTLSHAASEDINVYYSTVNGTAVAGSDFTGVSGGFITIAAGQTTGQIVIAVTDDALVEHSESLQVKLDSVSPSYSDAITVSTTAASGTINDNDTAIVTISNAPTVTEGGNLIFGVTLSHAASEDINVYYSTVNGTAVAGSDFTGVSGGFITIAAGQTTGQIVIAVTDDVLAEHSESLQVKLDSVSPSYSDAITVSTTAATGTIMDNDAATVTISDAPTVTEGGNLVFGVTLSHAASEDINVYYSTVNGTAVAGSDFTGVNGGFITIAAGQTTGQIVIAVADDAVVEHTESLQVKLDSVSPSYSDAITVSTTAASGTITDNDTAIVTISDAPTVTEDGNLVFAVTLNHAASEDINVYYSTINGSAVAGSDFTGVSGGFITIAAGQTTGQIVIAVTDDALVEHSESLQVQLDSVSPGYSDAITVSTTAASGTINDNDTAIVTISNAPTVTEGGNLIFGVTLSHAASEDINVYYSTVNGTAVAGSDFAGVNGGFITIAAGQTTGQIVIAVTDNLTVEGPESMQVRLDSVSPSYNDVISVSSTPATGIIVDNDGATITIADAPTVLEGGNLDFVVTLNGSISQPVTLNYTLLDVTTTPGDYIDLTGGTITFNPGDTTAHIIIQTTQDNVLEYNDTLAVNLVVAPGEPLSGGITIPFHTAYGQINNDDTTTISISNGSAVEGGAMTFTVSLTNPSEAPIHVVWNITNITTTVNDYTSDSGTLHFAPGEVSKEFTVQTLLSSEVEPTKTFDIAMVLTGTNPPGITIASEPGTGTIFDAPVTAPPVPPTTSAPIIITQPTPMTPVGVDAPGTAGPYSPISAVPNAPTGENLPLSPSEMSPISGIPVQNGDSDTDASGQDASQNLFIGSVPEHVSYINSVIHGFEQPSGFGYAVTRMDVWEPLKEATFDFGVTPIRSFDGLGAVAILYGQVLVASAIMNNGQGLSGLLNIFGAARNSVIPFSQVGVGMGAAGIAAANTQMSSISQESLYNIDIDEPLLVSVSNPEIFLTQVSEQELVFIITLSKEADKNISIHYLIVEDNPEMPQPKILQEGDLRFLPGQIQNQISVPLDRPINPSDIKLFHALLSSNDFDSVIQPFLQRKVS